MNPFKLSNKAYDFIKALVTLVLPGVITLYLGLAQVWEWSDAEKIAMSLTLVNAFLGLFIGISSKNYEPAPILINPDPGVGVGVLRVGYNNDGNLLYSLETEVDPEIIKDLDYIRFKVDAEDLKNIQNGSKSP